MSALEMSFIIRLGAVKNTVDELATVRNRLPLHYSAVDRLCCYRPIFHVGLTTNELTYDGLKVNSE